MITFLRKIIKNLFRPEVEKDDTTEKVETTETGGKVESTDNTDIVETGDKVESYDNTDITEPDETGDKDETIETDIKAETGETADKVESADTTDEDNPASEEPPISFDNVNVNKVHELSEAFLSYLEQSEDRTNFEKPTKIIEKPLDLIIGFDMGTSSSKVVVQAPDLPDSPAWPIDFDKLGYGEMTYILPTRIYYDPEKGTLSLYKTKGSELPYTHIKTGLCIETAELESIIENKKFNAISKEALAVAYLGLAIKYIKEFILSKQSEVLSSYNKIYWSLNLGIPSPTVDHFKEKESFERVMSIAWVLSASNSDSVSLTAVENEIQEYNNDIESYSNAKVDCEIHLIPEIIAGSFGYTQSPVRLDGLHIIIDIGAFTVDVCGFRLSRNFETHENVSALFQADVKPLGTFCFHRMNGHSSYLEPVPEDIDDNDLADIKQEFLTTVRTLINQIKITHDPYARAFRRNKKLPFIIIGGGSKAKVYKRWINEIDQWIMFRHIKNEGLSFIKVPLPKDWPKDRDVYLSVAWGLSHRALDIGRFIAPSEIPELPPVEVEPMPDRVSKDQV